MSDPSDSDDSQQARDERVDAGAVGDDSVDSTVASDDSAVEPSAPSGRTRPHCATFRFPYQTAALADTVVTAIHLEAGDIQGHRSSVCVSRTATVVEVTVEADDPAALRAAKRTWFGLVDVAERTALLGS